MMRPSPPKTASSPTWDLAEPSTRWVGRTFGPYRLRALIQTDDQTTSWVADDRSTGILRRVVIKTPSNLDAQDGFQNETALALRLTHPQIVKGLARVDLDGRPGLVLEWVDGLIWYELLRRTRASGRWIPFDVATTLAIRALEALEHAHRLDDAQGWPLVHGALHPGVLWASFEGDARVAGFGDRGAGSGASGSVRHAYLAPEQISSRKVMPSTDVFAVAVCLMELLTGSHPFVRDSARDTLNAIASGERAPVAVQLPFRSSELETALERALQTDPRRRFATAEGFRRALDRALAQAGLRPRGKAVTRWVESCTKPLDPATPRSSASEDHPTARGPFTPPTAEAAPRPPHAGAGHPGQDSRMPSAMRRRSESAVPLRHTPSPIAGDTLRGARPLTADRFDLSRIRRAPRMPFQPHSELPSDEGSGHFPRNTDDLLELASRAQGFDDLPAPPEPSETQGRRKSWTWLPWRRRG